MKKLLLILALVLAGCASTPAYQLDSKLEIDPKLLQPCDTIPLTKVNKVTDVLKEQFVLYELYAKCARQQQDSINILNQLGGVR